MKPLKHLFDAEAAIYHAANKNIRKLADYNELEMLIESIIKQTQGELKQLNPNYGFCRAGQW